jgi:hypothetical protein
VGHKKNKVIYNYSTRIFNLSFSIVTNRLLQYEIEGRKLKYCFIFQCVTVVWPIKSRSLDVFFF